MQILDRKPFDVAEIEEGVEETYDPTREGTGAISAKGKADPIGDLRRIAQGSPNLSEAIPEASPKDIAEDPINPAHYRRHPSGIECIEVTRHMNFNVGNAIKYLWRYMDKGNPIENLKKAQWYIADEIVRLGGLHK